MTKEKAMENQRRIKGDKEEEQEEREKPATKSRNTVLEMIQDERWGK